MISKVGLTILALLVSLRVAALESSFFTENYLIGMAQDVRKSDLNPGNRYLGLPAYEAELDTRADWTLRDAEQTQLVKVRPRWVLPYAQTDLENPDETLRGGQGHLDLTDAYWESRWSDRVSSTVGLQVYQWGPAEMANPSNPIFHFNFNQKSAFYKEKGHALVRLNGQWSPEFGQVLILEPVSNRAAAWKEGEDFRPQALLKSEYQWNSQKYAALVFGDDEEGHFFVGEEGTALLTDRLSVYADARHTQGLRPFVPQKNASGFETLEEADRNDRFETVGVVGLRLEEDRTDWRLEYFHNSAGYSSDQMRAAHESISRTSPWLIGNLKRFVRPGLELPGRDYIYASVRVSDLGRRQDVTAFARLVQSLQDGSTSWQASLEKNLADSWTGYLEGTLLGGGSDDELSFGSNWQLLVGAKYVL